MDKFMDYYLANVLKQWVERHHLPEGGRERLLNDAAVTQTQPQSPNKFALSWLIGQDAVNSDILAMELPRKLTGWLYLSYRPSFGNLSIV